MIGNCKDIKIYMLKDDLTDDVIAMMNANIVSRLNYTLQFLGFPWFLGFPLFL